MNSTTSCRAPFKTSAANAKAAPPSQSLWDRELTRAVKGKRLIPSPQFIRGGWAGLATGTEARRAETIRLGAKHDSPADGEADGIALTIEKRKCGAFRYHMFRRDL